MRFRFSFFTDKYSALMYDTCHFRALGVRTIAAIAMFSYVTTL